MNKNKREMQEWAERLEQGKRDDELLSLAARLEKAGADEGTALPVEFQRQLRRDLLNQYPDAARPTRPFWRWAGALASVGLLTALVLTVWLSVSSVGRFAPGGAPLEQSSTPTVEAAAAAVSSAPPDVLRHTFLGYSVSGGIVTETMETDGGEAQTHSLLVPGIPVEVVMQWNSPADSEAATVFVHLLASDGSLVAQADAPVSASDGTPNETIVSLNLPDDLAPGEYQLVGGLIDPVTGERLPISTAEGEVTLLPLGDYTVSAGGDAELTQMNEALIELQGSETVLELNLQDANRDLVIVREITPASGAVLSGTAPIEFTITIDYALVSLPEANLDVKVTELMAGGSGRGVGSTVIPIEQGTGTTTVVVTVSPNELLKATELGLWIQIKPGDARSAPIFVDMPPDYRWSYTP